MPFPGPLFPKPLFPGPLFPPVPAASGPGGGPVPTIARTDHAALRDVAARLLATGRFAAVAYPGTPETREVAADPVPGQAVAWLARLGYQETRRVGSATQKDRTVLFRLWIEVREADDDLAAATLGSVEADAQNAIEGRQLGGFCRPAFTLVDRAADDIRLAYPRRRVAIDGSFQYGVNPLGTHDINT